MANLNLIVAAACAAIIALTPSGALAKGKVYYRGPASDHFDGTRFFNPDGEQGTGGAAKQPVGKLIKKVVDGPKGSWPKYVPVTPTKPVARVEGEEMVVTWIGHATALVQTQGLNILTDPVWAHRDSPVPMIGPKRVRAPGVKLQDLPKIDLILISHDHFDHLDVGALKWIWRRDRPTIVAGLGNDTLLAAYGVPALGRDWGQEVQVGPNVKVVLNRAHHWSAHAEDDRDRALWTGFTVLLPGGNLFYAGDTGAGDMMWAPEAAKYGPVRLALLPIGAFKPDLPPSGNHIGPDEAVTAFEQLHAAYALGVHWGTFELTPEKIDDPPNYLAKALQREHIAAARFRTTEVGEAWRIPAMDAAPRR